MFVSQSIVKKIKRDVTMKYYTTFKIGGNARFFYEAQSITDLQEALEWAKEKKIKWFILGHGSNILVSDKGFPGLVIKLAGDFKKISVDQYSQSICAGAGVMLPRLGMYLANCGWDEYIYMAVIPGTVGGAVCMNAGTTKEGEIKDNLISVDVLTENNQIATLFKEDLNFSYRYSNLLKTKNIVLSAKFKLRKKMDPVVLKRKINEVIALRRSKQPKNKNNCGSIFKNPGGGRTAGWYIEQADLKGKKIGNAQVAYEYANWIVNLGSATASDVKSLITLIQQKVYDKFGILLEREVVYVPEDV